MHMFSDRMAFISPLVSVKVDIKGLGNEITKAKELGMTIFGPALFIEDSGVNLISHHSLSDNPLTDITHDKDGNNWRLHIEDIDRTFIFEFGNDRVPTCTVDHNVLRNSGATCVHPQRSLEATRRTLEGRIAIELQQSEMQTNAEKVGTDGDIYPAMAAEQHRPRAPSEDQAKKINKVIKIHEALNHISFRMLEKLIEKGGLVAEGITGEDVRRAVETVGECPVCTIAKGNRGHRIAQDGQRGARAQRKVMELWHADLVWVRGPIKNMLIYFAVEHCTSFWYHDTCEGGTGSHVAEAMAKHKEWQRKAFDKPIREISWDEETAVSVSTPEVTTGIPYQHERHAERHVQSFRKRILCLMKSLPYVIPQSMLRDMIADIVRTWNVSPNERTLSDNYSSPENALRAERDMTRLTITEEEVDIKPGQLVVVNRYDTGKGEEAAHTHRAYAIVVSRALDNSNKIRVALLEKERTNHVNTSGAKHTYQPVQMTPLIAKTISEYAGNTSITEVPHEDRVTIQGHIRWEGGVATFIDNQLLRRSTITSATPGLPEINEEDVPTIQTGERFTPDVVAAKTTSRRENMRNGPRQDVKKTLGMRTTRGRPRKDEHPWGRNHVEKSSKKKKRSKTAQDSKQQKQHQHQEQPRLFLVSLYVSLFLKLFPKLFLKLFLLY